MAEPIAILRVIQSVVHALVASMKSRQALVLQVLTLQHQLAVAQQSGPKRPRLTRGYLVLDRDSVFSAAVHGAIESMDIELKQTTFRSPWQDGVAERWIGRLRQSLMHHVIVFNEDHLRRLLLEYVSYHNTERLHCSLGDDAPRGRPIEQRPSASAEVIALPRLGGLHHKYQWQEAA